MDKEKLKNMIFMVQEESDSWASKLILILSFIFRVVVVAGIGFTALRLMFG